MAAESDSDLTVTTNTASNEIIPYEHLYVGNFHWELNKRWHKWILFVSASKDQLIEPRSVKDVTYFLHPTFEPNRRHQTRSPFFMTCNGWGTFEITIAITFKKNALPKNANINDIIENNNHNNTNNSSNFDDSHSYNNNNNNNNRQAIRMRSRDLLSCRHMLSFTHATNMTDTEDYTLISKFNDIFNHSSLNPENGNINLLPSASGQYNRKKGFVKHQSSKLLKSILNMQPALILDGFVGRIAQYGPKIGIIRFHYDCNDDNNNNNNNNEEKNSVDTNVNKNKKNTKNDKIVKVKNGENSKDSSKDIKKQNKRSQFFEIPNDIIALILSYSMFVEPLKRLSFNQEIIIENCHNCDVIISSKKIKHLTIRKCTNVNVIYNIIISNCQMHQCTNTTVKC